MALPQRPLDAAIRVPLGNRLAFVVLLLAFAQRKIDLRVTSTEDNAKRNQRVALLHKLPLQVVDLLAVEQQLSWPARIVVEVLARLFKRRNMHSEKPDLVIIYDRIGILEVGAAIPNRLDFSPGQRYPGFNNLIDVIVVAGAPIRSDDLPPLVRAVGFASSLSGHDARLFRFGFGWRWTPRELRVEFQHECFTGL